MSGIWKSWTCALLVIGNMALTASCNSQPQEELNPQDPAGDYLVVSLVDSKSEFFTAARLLAGRHGAGIVEASPSALENVIDELRKREPACVAFVVHPDDLDVNLVNRIFALSTEVDEDPFVDFAWGVITGRDGAAAEKLVRASQPASKRLSPSIAMFGVGGAGLPRSTTQKAQWPLRKGAVPVTSFVAKGESDEERDAPFIAESMSQLGRYPIILLASHGYPDGLVAGPKAADLRGLDLAGSVLLNIACYTGVTKTWFDEDYQLMQVRKKCIDPAESFCLQAIDCGVAGYFAYSCPRPAGPAMMGDALSIAASGKSLGELFCENLQSIVLAHLLAGDSRVTSTSMTDGAAIDRERTPGSAVKKMSTGGVLFGDPAFCPFPAMEGSDARFLEIVDEEMPDCVVADIKVVTPLFHFFAGDQINYWDNQHASMRMECALPIGEKRVDRIDVRSVPEGVEEYRWVAAIEHVSGQRFLRWKLNFPQPVDAGQLQKMQARGLSSRLEVHLGDGEPADSAILRGVHSKEKGK